jgi:hypothetical protein
VARAAVGRNHQSAAADDRFCRAKADVFVGQAADLRMTGGQFDRRGGCSLLRAAQHERRQAKFVGRSQRQRHAVFGGPMLGVAIRAASAQQHDSVARRQAQPLPHAVSRCFIGRCRRQFQLARLCIEAQWRQEIQICIDG